jgi:hypothetical protein
VSEFSLYCHYRSLWGLPIPEFYYVPKLLLQGGDDLSDVSKTAGNAKIADFRNAGWSSKEVRQLLEESCLMDPTEGWRFGNVKQQPTLVFPAKHCRSQQMAIDDEEES